MATLSLEWSVTRGGVLHVVASHALAHCEISDADVLGAD